MCEIVYPSAFERRLLALEAPGGEVRSLSVVVPSVVRPGERFEVKLALLDDRGYPSMQADGTLELRASSGRPSFARVKFSRGRPATAILQDVSVEGVGFHRFEAEFSGIRSYSNPCLCASEPANRIYWGDPHVHTILSDCHPDKCRSLNFCYTAARHLAGLDWVAATDHVSNGRCNFAKWKEQCAACEAYNEPGEFVTIPGYEGSFRGGAGGDNNFYFLRPPEMFLDDCETGSVRTACMKLEKEVPAGGFFAAPHHTTRNGKHGEITDDVYPGPELMPVVEIHSKWGTSEYRGNPNPLKKTHPGPAYAVDLLNRGLRLGFIAGTDTHATMPSGGGLEPDHIDRMPGITAVFAGALTREAVFDAIRNRNCYGTSLERVYLNGRIAGADFGRIVNWTDTGKPRRIEVSAAGKSDLETVELIRNGEPVACATGDGWNGDFSFTDEEPMKGLLLESKHLGLFAYYYVRVACASGARAWSSPVWLVCR